MTNQYSCPQVRGTHGHAVYLCQQVTLHVDMLLTHIHRTTLTVNRMTPCRYLMRSYSSHTPSCMRCAQKNYFSHASRAPPAQDLHSPSRRTESALSRGSRVCAAPTLTPQHREIVLAIIRQKLYRLSVRLWPSHLASFSHSH